MRIRAAAVLPLSAAGLLACSSGTGGQSTTTPTPAFPVVPSPQPPARDISGPWSGTESDSNGNGTVQLNLLQDGGVVTGNGLFTEDKQRGVLFAGILSGSTLTFNLNYGVNCVRRVNGTLTAGASTMSGTFSGTSDCSGSLGNGQVSLTSQRPDVEGTWSGDAPSILGAGTWTWTVQQDGTAVTAQVTIATNNLHETDTLTGALYWAIGNFTLTGSFPIAGCPGVTASVSQDIGKPSLTSTQMNDLLTLSNNCLGPSLSAPFTLTKN